VLNYEITNPGSFVTEISQGIEMKTRYSVFDGVLSNISQAYCSHHILPQNQIDGIEKLAVPEHAAKENTVALTN